MARMDETTVDQIFTYHKPSPEQTLAYEAIRSAAKSYALVILKYVHECADRTVALRSIRESVMTANAAVALGGLI